MPLCELVRAAGRRIEFLQNVWRCGACKSPFPPVNESLEVGLQTKMHSASGEMHCVPGERRTSHFSQTLHRSACQRSRGITIRPGQ
jgi:hypothetical protein